MPNHFLKETLQNDLREQMTRKHPSHSSAWVFFFA